MKHVHCDLIVAWANGAKIQWREDGETRWNDCVGNPGWAKDTSTHYRIKPEPEPDKVVYQTVVYRQAQQRVVSYIETEDRTMHDNVMFIFDGETGKLKSAEVL